MQTIEPGDRPLDLLRKGKEGIPGGITFDKPPEIPPMPVNTKPCTICHKPFYIWEYPERLRYGKVVVMGQCVKCTKEYQINYRKKNQKEWNAYQKEYRRKVRNRLTLKNRNVD